MTTNTNLINKVPYLRTTRSFSEEPKELSVELNKTYIDIANYVNNRTIGLFPTNKPAITGESFFLFKNEKQQALRQVYTFTTTAPINHGIKTNQIDQFYNNYGEFISGGNFYGLIFGSNVAIAGQISFYITPTQIIFLVGAGAPALTRGLIVLQWLSQP